MSQAAGSAVLQILGCPPIVGGSPCRGEINQTCLPWKEQGP